MTHPASLGTLLRRHRTILLAPVVLLTFVTGTAFGLMPLSLQIVRRVWR